VLGAVLTAELEEVGPRTDEAGIVVAADAPVLEEDDASDGRVLVGRQVEHLVDLLLVLGQVDEATRSR
jgi:hypothetical protein